MSDTGVRTCIFEHPHHSRPHPLDRTERGRTPPGPRGIPVIGSLPFLTGDGLAKMTAWARAYGDIFQYRSFHLRVCFLNNPELIEDVLVTNSHNYIHGRGVQANPRFLGRGLLTNEGESWRHQRRVMQPAFHQRCIQRFASLIVERTGKLIAGWHEGQSIDLYKDVASLTLDIVARILFDVEIDGQTGDLAAAVDALQMRNARGQIMVRATKYLPTPRNLRYWKTIRRAEKVVYGLIRQRRAAARYGGDLLSMLLEARNESGDPMSERQIRDEVMTLVAAAYDTTALAISYACYLLGQHPETGAELADELRQVLGDRPPRFEDLPSLPCLDRVLKEAMRLYPPAPALVREALNDVEIGGYRLPRKTTFILCPWIMQRDPRYFDAPDEFRPRRWTREFEKQLPRFAYFPFGGGARKCIGANLARMEAALILATIVRRIGMRPAPGFQLDLVPCLNLRPRGGIKMVLGAPFAGRTA